MHESGQSAAPRWGGALIRALTLSTLVQIVATASALALTAMAPVVAADLGIGAHWIGYQVSLVYFSGAFASATAGAMVRRYGPVAIEQVALLTFAIGFLGLAGGALPTILVGSLFIGVGYGFNNPAASHILNGVAPPATRNLVYSIKQAGVPVGAVVASLAFPPLAAWLGWRLAYLALAAAPLALIFAIRLGRHGIAHERDREARFGASFVDEQRLVWRIPALRALALLGLLFSVVQLSLSAFAVVMLARDAGWTLLEAGSLAAMTQAAGAFGRVFWGALADRTGAGFLILALLGLISGAIGIGFAWLGAYPVFIQIAMLLALGACSIGWNGVLLAETARRAPRGQVGPVTGAVLVYTFIGVILGPALFAILFGRIGSYAITFAIFGVFSLLGAIIAAAAHARLRIERATAAAAAGGAA